MTKNVVLFGSMGYNLGDQAIAMEIRNLLQKDGYSVRVASINSDLVDQDSVFLFNRNSISGWISIINEIRRADVVLIGGGTMIQDKLGISIFRGMLPMVTQIAFLSKILNKKVKSIAIGVDDLHTSLGKLNAWIFLKLLDAITVRDEIAKSNVSKLIKGKKIGIIRDPAFLFESEGYVKNNNAVISLVNEDIFDALMIERTVDLVNELLKSYDNVTLLCMDIRYTEEYEIYKQVLSNLDDSRVKINIPKGYTEAAEILRSAKLCVCFRLHAIILSFGYTEILGYSRSAKTAALGEYLGIPIMSIEDFKNDYTANYKVPEIDYKILDGIKSEIPSKVIELVSGEY